MANRTLFVGHRFWCVGRCPGFEYVLSACLSGLRSGGEWCIHWDFVIDAVSKTILRVQTVPVFGRLHQMSIIFASTGTSLNTLVARGPQRDKDATETLLGAAICSIVYEFVIFTICTCVLCTIKTRQDSRYHPNFKILPKKWTNTLNSDFRNTNQNRKQ